MRYRLLNRFSPLLIFPLFALFAFAFNYLSGHIGSANKKRDTFLELFGEELPTKHIYRLKISNDRIEQKWLDPPNLGKCAVVGSSGNLKHSFQGSFIDRHDSIIRVNFAPTKGYEADVGAKTTHYFLSHNMARDLVGLRGELAGLEAHPDSTLIFIHFKDPRALHRAIKRGIPGFEGLAWNRVWWINRHSLLNRLYLPPKDKTPSTGLTAVSWSIALCDEVNLFGFGPSPDGFWDYYYKAKKIPRTHAIQAEYQFIRDLAVLDHVHFHPGNQDRTIPPSSNARSAL